MAQLNYFFDNQLRRYIEQVQRVFSHFQVYNGRDQNGNDQFIRVPCTYGDQQRMAQHIIRQNSENAQLPVPSIAIYDLDMQIVPERRQLYNHVDKRQFFERKFDEEQNKYTNEDGFRYTVERYMPVPYDLTVIVDVWYTSTDHKMQICEQIMMLFNPDIDIQTSVNSLDWSSLTKLELIGVTWNTTGIPAGLDENLRITSFQFKIPIWINPPATVKRQKVIHQIITDISTVGTIDRKHIPIFENDFLNVNPQVLNDILNSGDDIQRIIITPGNHYISVDNNVITLLGADQGEINPATGEVWSWQELIEQYDSPLTENISLLRLRPGDNIEDIEMDYVGRIRYHTEPNKLVWTVDLETIPQDTIDSFDAVINPLRNLPGEELPIPQIGQRYLVTEEVSNNADSAIWSNILIQPNDIIEFDGTNWIVSFDSNAESSVQFTSNRFNGEKLRFDPTQKEWNIIPDGNWSPGFWRLIL